MPQNLPNGKPSPRKRKTADADRADPRLIVLAAKLAVFNVLLYLFQPAQKTPPQVPVAQASQLPARHLPALVSNTAACGPRKIPASVQFDCTGVRVNAVQEGRVRLQFLNAQGLADEKICRSGKECMSPFDMRVSMADAQSFAAWRQIVRTPAP